MTIGWLGKMAAVAIMLCLAFQARGAESDLPPEVRAEIQVNIAQDHMKANRWAEAAKAFDEVTKLNAEPETQFYFWYGKTLIKAGRQGEGVAQLTTYLKKPVRRGSAQRNRLPCFAIMCGRLNWMRRCKAAFGSAW